MATLSSILAWRIRMDRGAWWATVHGVAKSWTRLRTHTRGARKMRDLSTEKSCPGHLVLACVGGI